MQRHLVLRFIGAHDVVSTLIQWTTNSLWCHTEALSRDGKSWIGAHAFTGVQPLPLDWCKPARVAMYAIPVTEEEYARAMTWLESQIGLKYDYLDIVGLALHNRAGFSNTRAICSALMLKFMMQADLRPLNVLEGFTYLVTPETLHLSPVFIGRGITLSTLVNGGL